MEEKENEEKENLHVDKKEINEDFEFSNNCTDNCVQLYSNLSLEQKKDKRGK